MRTVVVTGANAGIGLETAVALATSGDRVVIACRNPAKADVAVGEIRARSGSVDVEQVTLDLASFASVRGCAATLLDIAPHIDVLINNAGLIVSRRTTTEDGFETMFGVNHLGHFLLTSLLEEAIRGAAAPRVINVASMAHWGRLGGLRFGDLQGERHFNTWLAYAQSKTANILFTRELARRWSDVKVNALHPGVVKSNFGREGDTSGLSKWGIELGVGTVSAVVGARTTVHLATSEEGGRVSGAYFANCRPARTAPWASRDADARRLWSESVRLIESVPRSTTGS